MPLNIISDPQVVLFCSAKSCHFQEGLHFTSRCVVVTDWEREKEVERKREGKGKWKGEGKEKEKGNEKGKGKEEGEEI